MEFQQLSIPDIILVKPTVFEDQRGFFMEFYHVEKFKLGKIDSIFVQDNHARSVKNTLRGMHFQAKYPQAKLLRCLKGKIFDVAVDIRQGSPTYSQWMAIVLSEENKKQVWIPPGFAHGFLVLSEVADFEYKCTDYYDADDECSVLWCDPSIGISWPELNPILSARDVSAPLLSEIFT